MTEKNELLSSGELAKITGSTKKALRYYEKSGLLTPTYINPENGYRYYSLSQIPVVETIQICVLLDIPLNNLKNFINQNHSVDYSSFLEYGKQVAEIKLHAVQHGLNFFHYAQKEMARYEKYKDLIEPYTRKISEKYYLIAPYDPEKGEKAIYTQMSNLFEKAIEEDLLPLYERGLLYEFLPDGIKRHIFMEINPTTQNHEHIKIIPPKDYRCTFVEGRQIEKAPELFPPLFKGRNSVLIIETEIIIDHNLENKPMHELRISLN